jgi:hypothetical protein
MKKQTIITSEFKMDDKGELSYKLDVKGNMQDVVELGHKIFIDCKKRFASFRRDEEVKEQALYNKFTNNDENLSGV